MDPQTGTFLSVDPVIPAYDDPQSLNAYAYARNNPVSYNDPTGMCVIMFHCVGLMPGFYGSMHTRSSSEMRQIVLENPEVGVEATYTHKVSVGDTQSLASVTYDLRKTNGDVRTITDFRLPEITPELGPSQNVPTELEQLAQDLATSIPSVLPKSIAEIEAGAFQLGRPLHMDAEGNAIPDRSNVLYGAPAVGGLVVGAGRLSHIFRAAEGHVNPRTIHSMNRFIALFRSVASNPANGNAAVASPGAMAAGNIGFSQIFRSGRQVWVHIRNGQIWDAGVSAAKNVR